MPTSRTNKQFVDLPGKVQARVDANSVVCARVEVSDSGSYVVIHTNEGFAFGAFPPEDLSLNDFYKEVLSTIWPGK